MAGGAAGAHAARHAAAAHRQEHARTLLLFAAAPHVLVLTASHAILLPARL